MGKTTAAAVLGATLAEHGESVVLIDADLNQPLAHWASRPTSPPPSLTVYEGVSEATMMDEIDRAARAAKWVIVDL